MVGQGSADLLSVRWMLLLLVRCALWAACRPEQGRKCRGPLDLIAGEQLCWSGGLSFLLRSQGRDLLQPNQAGNALTLKTSHSALSSKSLNTCCYFDQQLRIIIFFKGIVHPKIKIAWKCIASCHPRCRLVCIFIRTDLKKLIIPSLAHQWILCSEWVPSEWESKQLIKTSQ